MEGVSLKDCVIEKPQTDRREYRPMLLDNGMQVMLVSDSKCDKAAAALSVKVGSIFDPKEVPGLAHFCEHMLFLGTKKYPKENEYNEFLSAHSGMSNAETGCTYTVYYFAVGADHLQGALDRFAQFFLEPLFDDSSTDRELQAVESEHSKNQQNDMWRFMQLMRSDANPKHPLCHFGTGNLETLKTIPEKEGLPVRDRLLEFHGKYYSSNIMCLSILGKESLSELESIAKELFGPVPNKSVKIPEGPDVGGGEPTFITDGWPRLVQVVPVQDLRLLTFSFILPQLMPKLWRSQPHSYLSNNLGHEGEGSLLSALKQEGLATELSAGPHSDEAGACVLCVDVYLTEKGEGEVKRVGELLFAYIRLLQELPASPELFREMQCLREMEFQFRSLSQPMSAVRNLTVSMQSGLPIDKVFSGPTKLWDFDPKIIADAASYLKCSNLMATLATKQQADACTSTERWYGTKYGASTLPEEWREAWERHRLGDGSKSAVEAAAALGLALPKPNPFVPEDLELKPRPDDIPQHPEKVASLPESVLSSIRSNLKVEASLHRLLQVYFRQDATFDLPKAHLMLDLFSGWSTQSLAATVATLAWSQSVVEELNEFAYDAEVAGLRYSLNGTRKGLSLSIGGYQDKFPVLLKVLAEKMVKLTEVPAHTYGIVYEKLLRDTTNDAYKSPPYHQAMDWQRRCVHEFARTTLELLEEVKVLTRENLTGVGEKVLSSCYVEGLLQGNYTKDELSKVLEPLLPVIKPQALLPAVPLGGIASYPCEPGACIVVTMDGANPEEKNGALLLMSQIEQLKFPQVCFVELAEQCLRQACFDELRTKQTLGYIVDLAAYQECLGKGSYFAGLRIIVQSEKHPAELHRRADAWLKTALGDLLDVEKVADEKLKEYVEAVITRKREKPKKLADEVNRNHYEISSRHFRFSRREDIIEFLSRPSADVLQEFRDFVRNSLIPARCMSVEIRGSVAQELPADAPEAAPFEGAATVLKSLDDIKAFREGLTWIENSTAISE